MKKHLTTLGIAVLLGAPCMGGAETMLPPDAQSQGMKSDNPETTTEPKSGNTVKAEIVKIDRGRIITETAEGKQLVFHVEDGSSADFNVGDQLELMIDNQTQTGVILNVFPKDKEPKS
jgi:hypothetical protein